MKCNELKVYKVYTTMNEGAFGFCEGADPTDIELEHESVCLKSDVDKFIAELKEKLHDVDNQWNEQCKEIAELKSENEHLKKMSSCKFSDDCLRVRQLKRKLEDVQATAYTESTDAGMRERRLRRALYKACANWALSTLAWLDCIDQGEPGNWAEMQRKCLKKAEEYK